MADKTYKYIIDFKAQTEKFKRDVGGVEGAMKSVALAAGVAFGTREIMAVTAELIKLGGEAEGVRAAFNKIADESKLDDLKKATRGTVAEIDLMKRSVVASNLGIPVENLANLLEFATKRAQDTGQSIDYLVESIVVGIGRKSPLILDNLGITAVALSEKLNGIAVEQASVADIAAAVGEIAAESMEKSGAIIDSNAVKIQRLTAQWADFKLEVAESPGFNNFVSKELDELSRNFAVFFNENISGWQKFLAFTDITGGNVNALYNQIQAEKERAAAVSAVASEYEKMYAAARDPFGTADAGKKQITTYGDILAKIKEYETLLSEADVTNTKYISGLFAQIESLNKQKKAFEDLNIAAANQKKIEEQAEKNKKAWQDFNKELQSGLDLSREISLELNIDFSDQVADMKAGMDDVLSGSGKDYSVDFYMGPLDQLNKKLEELRSKQSTALSPDQWKLYQQEIDATAAKIAEFTGDGSLQQLQDMALAVSDAVGAGFNRIGESIIDSLDLANDGFEGFVKNMFSMVNEIISMLLANAVANAITGASSGALGTGPAAPFTLPAFIATMVGGVMGAFASIPKFADGGVVYGPTLGVFGEYPGASSNPEIVAPLDKLRAMIEPRGDNFTLQPSIAYDGDQLRIFLNRIEKNAYKRT